MSEQRKRQPPERTGTSNFPTTNPTKTRIIPDQPEQGERRELTATGWDAIEAERAKRAEQGERCGGSGTIPNDTEGMPQIACPGCPDCTPVPDEEQGERYETTVRDKRTGHPVSGRDGDYIQRAEAAEARASELSRELYDEQGESRIEHYRAAYRRERDEARAEIERLREALREIRDRPGLGGNERQHIAARALSERSEDE